MKICRSKYSDLLKRVVLLLCAVLLFIGGVHASYLYIPMDTRQKDHLKAYGIAYFALTREIEVSWLLNYEGGSFMCPFDKGVERECLIRNVSYEVIADLKAAEIRREIAEPSFNVRAALSNLFS